MLTFHKVRWKNILSYGNSFTELNLDSHKTTLIYAKNGQGKSVLIDALCFVLYGKPFRKINKPLLINSINKKQLVVEIEFSTNNKKILVKRGMNPDFFEIWIDGVLKDQDAKVADYQEFLEKHILRMNFKTFTQIVVLGSADYVPFMKLPAANRKEVIEDILDIKIFSLMDKLLGKRVTDNKEAVTENNYKISNVKQKIEMEYSHIERVQQNNDDIIKDKESKIVGYQQEIAAFQAQHDELDKKVDEVLVGFDKTAKGKISFKITKLREVKVKLLDKKAEIEKEIKFYTDNNNCPTCTQLIEQGFKSDMIKNKTHKHNELQKGLDQWLVEFENANKILADLEIIEGKISDLKLQQTTIFGKISLKQAFINSLVDEIAALKKKDTTVHDESNLEKYKQELVEVLAVAEGLSKNKKIMDVAGSILKDGGIKSRIIKQYVPIINGLMNKYLTALDFYVNFEFDEEFNEKIKSRYRDEFSYASFSNGQKVRIDLAILIAWRGIAEARNSTACNLLILDEIFDNSLDLEGTEEFIKLLKHINKNINAFVISPKGDLLVDKFSNSIKVEFKNNFSRLVDKGTS